MKRRNLKTNRAVYILLTLWLTVSACQNNTYYHSYQSASTAGWHKNDTFVFSLPNTISPLNYEYEIGIRHKDTYKYRDLWLTINEDTLHLYLAVFVDKQFKIQVTIHEISQICGRGVKSTTNLNKIH